MPRRDDLTFVVLEKPVALEESLTPEKAASLVKAAMHPIPPA